MSVLVIGEALIDVIYDVSGKAVARTPGGSPLNVAVGLGRLNRRTTLLTRIGEDNDGAQIIDHCLAAEVNLAPGSITSHPTSLAHAHLTSDGSATYQFEIYSNYPSPPTHVDERSQLLANAPSALHFGSIGAHIKPGATQVQKWLEFYKDHATIFYDPNVRLACLESLETLQEEVASYLPFVDIFKANTEDIAAIYPDLSPAQVANKLLEAGVLLVVITEGGEGFTLYTKTRTVFIPAISVSVVDTVGAGDSLSSALIDGLGRLSLLGADTANLAHISQQSLISLGYYAATAASITVNRRGANPPTRNEIALHAQMYHIENIFQ